MYGFHDVHLDSMREIFDSFDDDASGCHSVTEFRQKLEAEYLSSPLWRGIDSKNHTEVNPLYAGYAVAPMDKLGLPHNSKEDKGVDRHMQNIQGVDPDIVAP